MKNKTLTKVSADYLASLCLENPEYQVYEDKDLINATTIFSHFLIDMIWTTNQKLSQSKREKLAETTGKEIRKLILKATGKDTHKMIKNLTFGTHR